MPKPISVCNGCGGYIYALDTCRVRVADDGRVLHYHKDAKRDCLADRERKQTIDFVAKLGEE